MDLKDLDDMIDRIKNLPDDWLRMVLQEATTELLRRTQRALERLRNQLL